jgi:hypothetical protein
MGFGDFLVFSHSRRTRALTLHLGVYRLSPAMVLDRLDYVALAAFVAVVFILGVFFRDDTEGGSADTPARKTARPCET